MSQTEIIGSFSHFKELAQAMGTQWEYVANPSHVLRHEILDIEPEATCEEKSLQNFRSRGPGVET